MLCLTFILNHQLLLVDSWFDLGNLGDVKSQISII